MKIFLVLCVSLLLASCAEELQQPDLPETTPLPFFPDTQELSTLHFTWDYPLTTEDVHWAGIFGIPEGRAGEIATELELQLNTWHDPVYALSDGVVVTIREAENPFEEGEVESVWVRYGHNAIIKYVHIYDPQVKVGDLVHAGDIIGYTVHLTEMDKGFYEVELRLREGDHVYAYPFVEYCDESCDILRSFWSDPFLTRRDETEVGGIPWKVMDKIESNQLETTFFAATHELSRLPTPDELEGMSIEEWVRRN